MLFDTLGEPIQNKWMAIKNALSFIVFLDNIIFIQRLHFLLPS